MHNEEITISENKHPFYNLNITESKKKTLNKKYKTLNKESFEAFLSLLKKFNYNYMYCDNIEYWKAKKQLVEIQEITKNPDFDKIYRIWEKQFTEVSDKFSFTAMERELNSIHKNLN